MDVGRDPFAPYSGDLGNLRPEDTSFPFLLSLHFLYTQTHTHTQIYIYIYIFFFKSCLLLVLQVLNDHS